MLFRAGGGAHLAYRSGTAPAAGEVAVPFGLAQLSGLRVGDRVRSGAPTNEHRTIRGFRDLRSTCSNGRVLVRRRHSVPAGLSDKSGPPDPVPVLVDQPTALTLATQLDLSTHYAWDLYLSLTGITYPDALNLPNAYVQFSTDVTRSGAGGNPLVVQDQPPHVSSGVHLDRRGPTTRCRLRVPILLVLLQILVVTLVVLAGVGVLDVPGNRSSSPSSTRGGSPAGPSSWRRGSRRCWPRCSPFPSASRSARSSLASRGSRTDRGPGTRGSPPASRSARSRSGRQLRRRARSCCGSRRSRPSVERSSTSDARRPGRHALRSRVPRSSSSSCPWDSSRSRSSGTVRQSRLHRPGIDRPPPAVRADARDPRCVLPADPRPVVGTRIARREDRTVPTALDLPGGPPTRTGAGGGLRVGGPRGARHRAALHLDDLPGDDAAEPRGRGARVRRRRLGGEAWGARPAGRSRSTGRCRPAWPTSLGCGPMGSGGRTRTRRRASRSIPRPSARRPGGGPTSRRIPSRGCSIVWRPRPRG